MRKRSSYRPKAVRLDNMAWLKQGMVPLREVKSEYLMLRVKNHAAMTEITQGRGGRDHVDTLIAALNMTEALARVRATLGQDWADEIRAGQDALLHLARRGIAPGGRFVLTGLEMAAINLALEVHDAQLEQCTVAELEKAIGVVHEELRSRRARIIGPKEMA